MKDIELIFDNKTKKYYSNESLLKGILNHTFLNTMKSQGSNNYNGRPVDNLDPGLFKKNTGAYNIQAACNWLHKHAFNSSQHVCAKFVRSAIDVGFNTNPNGNDSYTGNHGRPDWAWKYINFLPKIGFKFVDKVDNSYNGENGKYSPEPGDIAVYTKGGDTHVPGHICMWTGAEWASDFRQRNMIVYKTTPKAYIFRFEK